MKKIIVFLALMAIPFFSQTQAESPNPFFLLTIPKSGTHLIWKTMMMLTGRECQHPGRLCPPLGPFSFPEDLPNIMVDQGAFNTFCLDAWHNQHKFPMSHFNFGYFFQGFVQMHPNFKPIVFIRDLRDVCISLAYFQWADIEKAIGPSTIQQKIMWIIMRDGTPSALKILHVGKNAREAALWMRRPDTIVLKYEDLVGPEGGGTKQAQYQALTRLANGLNIPMDEARLSYLADNIYGNKGMPMHSSTFRDGKTGKWRAYFSSRHKKAFKKYLGKYQLDLGYSVDD